ncbi:undecaprenyldiphospho-muramoylpentapeptide beta-N-acetylglucosaminyltransferase [Lysobacter sp. GX 14042]|uniref:undecaprenyldiphospho-muramoylpentapeptide beta-N-acetylglucosaminyltransferase n=1 Tax=Lysobacter sp. GX 14042 TaxID=2907155 RepID=UPI001F444346|nr:undecaprenyldiphospho-muramoylpentapeptide beta-N-acetylglucosaminyltransferase [Lysobacter sp. GX 14042]MCE7031981.1 undecaprenyldiphospho-muramoylpentapeptide beta-N-acetylglucosaminyltransferase [Lysobacter sp. GX 14042]
MSGVAGGRPVMILAGGTGGHIFPGLAVADALRARGVPVRWLGAAGRMETRLVPQHGIAIDTLEVAGLRGRGLAATLAAPFRLLGALRAAGKLLATHQPRAVVSFGGFAAGPGGLAAKLAGIPLVVHEQNRAAGLTNRVLARWAGRVLTGFPDTFDNEQVVGNPVRAAIAAVPAPEQRFEGRQGPLRLLVLGGSQGARALNRALPSALAVLRGRIGGCEVRHQCGEQQIEDAREAYRNAGFAPGEGVASMGSRVRGNDGADEGSRVRGDDDFQVSLEPFIADMAQAYAWADLVVCRAGALTLAELCAAGVGSLLVPFPAAVDDHQTRNAEYLVDRGAAQLLPEGEAPLEFARRLSATLEILAERADLLPMAQAARALARPDAADAVASAVLEMESKA